MKYLKKFEGFSINEELVMGAGEANRYKTLSDEINEIYQEYIDIERSSTSYDYGHETPTRDDLQNYATMDYHSPEKFKERAAEKECYDKLIAVLKEWKTTDSNFVELKDIKLKEKVREISGLKEDQEISSLVNPKK